ncbi:Nramp family divalent metal transporter [Paraglaciecola chathamensis]|uniref:Nramp family divalent metal transporter n=1 Tax=Paraglaciecola chathamensis TaxID=368405 RepID=A0ABS0WI36_9ALTE|nr:Nramp family divalent metal transporter [Paraglaciecola chathamensis]MBJ2138137.1 Nramp family divalent metal transporter [Paraglaciecola chathamensis]
MLKNISSKFGPGILFAASSVGTSHLVQSTRAGAEFGFTLALLILFTCLLKYPAFRFGTDYAVATGKTLIDAYFKQGRSSVFVYIIEVLATMFIAASAVTVVCAGLISSVLAIDVSIKVVSIGVLLFCVAILLGGSYARFEKITTFFVSLFMVLICIAVALAVGKADISSVNLLPAVEFEQSNILFIIAVAGWMPTVVGASVWQSLWVCAKSKQLGRPLTAAEARFDFNLGYILTVGLAFGFLLLGALLLYAKNVTVAEGATSFATQLISIFTQSIGSFAYFIIAIAAIAVMISTLLTILDASPRAVGSVFALLKNGSETTQSAPQSMHAQIIDTVEHESHYYRTFLIIQCIGCSLVILFFMSSFKVFIDFATSVAFLTAPIIAFMNHKAMVSAEVATAARPSQLMRYWSLTGITVMALFGLVYINFGLLG